MTKTVLLSAESCINKKAPYFVNVNNGVSRELTQIGYPPPTNRVPRALVSRSRIAYAKGTAQHQC